MADTPEGDNGEEAQNKKPQEQPREVTIATSLESLPIELIELIVARVPLCNHPAISLISKLFGRIIASPHLLLTRSQLAISEHVLYALIGFPPFPPSWYILYRSNASLRLRRVNTLPPMPSGSAVVTVGHEIYVIGGSDGTRYLSNVTLIDCRTHTCRSLPSMRVGRYRAAAGVVDGKIYVMGGLKNQSKDWIGMFDLERQIWLVVETYESYVSGEFETYDVVKEKIYALTRQGLYVCEPRERKAEGWLHASELRGLWQASSCVVDDMLCTIDVGCWHGHPIIVFDPEKGLGEGVWKPVRGVYDLPPCLFWYAYESKMANVGGKLVILVGNQRQLWNYYGVKYICCVEIALERRQGGGEIWGNVKSVDVVFETTGPTPFIELCRTVIV
ncbi:hypothetical protein N665_0005s0157 [Sinapis alba]|nr:hypothetical protein N665_0005s0157 [Sinapis alba]